MRTVVRTALGKDAEGLPFLTGNEADMVDSRFEELAELDVNDTIISPSKTNAAATEAEPINESFEMFQRGAGAVQRY